MREFKLSFANSKKLNYPSFLNLLKNNLSLLFILLLYIFTMVSVISWGTPSIAHPFNYQMDEWHSMQSVRALFKYGTSNVAGAALGPVFHYLLTGILLVPFVLLKIIYPFGIHSSIDMLAMQQKLFIILRLNTIFFGVLSFINLTYIAKKYFKLKNYLLVCIFILSTPVWLVYSNYYIYNIALVFWISLTLVLLFEYLNKSTKKILILASISTAFACGTKISALALLPLLFLVILMPKASMKIKIYKLLSSTVVFLITFLIFGTPDIFTHFSSYKNYLLLNISYGPSQDKNYILPYSNTWEYLLFTIFPLNLGYILYILYFLTIIYTLKQLIYGYKNKHLAQLKYEQVLLFGLFFFFLSLCTLGLGANGNRLLVLLPFLSLLTALFLNELYLKIKYKKAFVIVIILLLLIQFAQSYLNVFAKWNSDPRQLSSAWIQSNLPKGTVIGIENIPIYQMLPDVVEKEFYQNLYNRTQKNKYHYEVIDSKSKNIPKFVIITNREVNLYYRKVSDSKDLIIRLEKSHYKIVKEFKPSKLLYFIYKNELNFLLSGIVQTPTITFYKKY